MKHIFSLIIIFSNLLSIHAFHEPWKSVPSYQITHNEPDHSLKNNESHLIFTFRDVSSGVLSNKEIKGSCNEIQRTIETSKTGQYSINIQPSKYIFQFYYNDEFYEVYTDSIEIKPGYRVEITINFKSSIIPVTEDKPVIYTYSKQPTPIHIELKIKGDLTFTYPPYTNGWSFTAFPDGTIKMNGRDYKYLFWEGETKINTQKINWNEGYLIGKKDLLSFLEDKLTEMGLNSVEKQDYITYWYPQMCKYEKTYIHFLFNEIYNEYANISINPAPDNLFRVNMIWCNADELNHRELTPQVIPVSKHEGLTVIEWGGTELDQLPQPNF